MLVSSLCIYSAEHEAQPELYKNAFSGIWWSLSTIFTVGYGDIYPITPLGQIMTVVITFLGVGAVAIPTGIISAGFVEEYREIARASRQSEEVRHTMIEFISEGSPYDGMNVKEAERKISCDIMAIQRDGELIVPVDAHPDCEKMRAALISGDYGGVIAALGNTLEEISLKLVPEIRQIKEELTEMGFDGVLMSGSGSTVFAITRNGKLVERARNIMRNRRYFVRVTRILNGKEEK